MELESNFIVSPLYIQSYERDYPGKTSSKLWMTVFAPSG
jgi:hypothetical protein